MLFLRRAAWLCACFAALAPHLSIAGTARARLTVGVTVVTPCRIGTQGDSIVSCMGRVARVTKGSQTAATMALPSTPDAATSYAKFVEVTF